MQIRGRRTQRIQDDGDATSAVRGEGVARSDDAGAQLIERIAAGDVDALDAMYERFGALVYSTSLGVLGDAHAAEDVTQDVFVRIWRRPDQYDPARGRFISWLLSVARNRAVDELRSRGRRQRFETDPPEAAERSPDNDDSVDPIAAALFAEDRAAVREALRGLPPEQREAIEMAYFRGLTQVEIAEELHQPLGTVKTRIRLGMQKMRAALLAAGWTRRV